MPVSIQTQDEFRSMMLASSDTHCEANGGWTSATLIFGVTNAS